MIEVKANTDKDKATTTEVTVEATGIEYMAEVIGIIHSLMKGMRQNDKILHTIVLRVIADHPHILLGKDEEFDEAKAFERFVAMAKFREGAN